MLRYRDTKCQKGSAVAVSSTVNDFPSFDDIREEFIAVALVDRELNTALMPSGGNQAVVQAEALAQGEVVRAVARAMEWLEQDDEIVEIRFTLGWRVEYIRPIDALGVMFLFVVLDKVTGQYFEIGRGRVRMAELAFGL